MPLFTPNAVSEKPAPVLHPIDRVSEVIFGLLMALTCTGSLSVATAGREDVRTMMIAALGCNLAWGLADAVMYLVRTVTERTRTRTLLARLRAADAVTGQRLVAEALPPRLAATTGPETLEGMRRRLAELPFSPARFLLGARDFKGALGVFLLVVLATFPVVIPFMLFRETGFALRVSNALSLAMLFAAGWALGRYAGGSPWWSGLAMAVTGAVLIGAIIALGGRDARLRPWPRCWPRSAHLPPRTTATSRPRRAPRRKRSSMRGSNLLSAPFPAPTRSTSSAAISSSTGLQRATSRTATSRTRSSSRPTPFGAADADYRLSVRQSQINWLSRTTLPAGHLWTRLEANLFPLDGKTAPTLKQLFVRWDDWIIVGKTYSTFMDDGVWTQYRDKDHGTHEEVDETEHQQDGNLP